MQKEKKEAKAAATIKFSVRLLYRYDWCSPKIQAGLSPYGTDRRTSVLDWEPRMKNRAMSAQLCQHQIPAHTLNQNASVHGTSKSRI